MRMGWATIKSWYHHESALQSQPSTTKNHQTTNMHVLKFKGAVEENRWNNLPPHAQKLANALLFNMLSSSARLLSKSSSPVFAKGDFKMPIGSAVRKDRRTW